MTLKARPKHFLVAVPVLAALSLVPLRGASAAAFGTLSALIGESGKLRAIFSLPGEFPAGKLAAPSSEAGVYALSPDGADPRICRAAVERLEPLEPWEASRLEDELRALADDLGEKPRTAFQPIRLAVTGSKVSPGLFESLELLGKERSLERLRSAAAGA